MGVAAGLSHKAPAAVAADRADRAKQEPRLARDDEVKEREADRMADAALAGRYPSASASNQPIARKPLGSDVVASPSPTGRLGSPMSLASRAYFEPRFGRDLSTVQIYADARAAETADSLDARAFAMGRHIVFAAREYAPDTAPGRALIAHELAHVVQQQAETGSAAVQRRPNETPRKERKPEIVSIKVFQGSLKGDAVLSSGQSIALNLAENDFPAGEYELIHISGGNYKPLEPPKPEQGAPPFKFRWWNPWVDKATREVRYGWGETVKVEIVPTASQRIAGLPPHIRRFLTAGEGELASAEEIENIAEAGELLQRSGIGDDELTLIEEEMRVARERGETGTATEVDALQWAQNYLGAQGRSDQAATENWGNLLTVAQRLTKEPLHLTTHGQLGSLLDPSSKGELAFSAGIANFYRSEGRLQRLPGEDAQAKIATMLQLLAVFQSLLLRFETLLIKDLRRRGNEALDAADASLLRMDRQFVGIWQPSIRGPGFFWDELERIRGNPVVVQATADRDAAKKVLDAQDKADKESITHPQSRSIDPIDYIEYDKRKSARDDRKEELDKAFNEVVKENTSLKLPPEGDVQKILSSPTPAKAFSLLRDFMFDGRDKVRKARSKISDRKILFAADIWVDAEEEVLKKAVGSRGGSDIALLVHSFARLRKSETSFWDDLLRVVEFVAMFVPGPIGWGIRGVAALAKFDKTMEKLSDQSTLYGAGATAHAPSGAALALAELALDTLDLPVGRAAAVERRAATTFERSAAASTDDVVHAAGAGKAAPSAGTAAHVDVQPKGTGAVADTPTKSQGPPGASGADEGADVAADMRGRVEAGRKIRLRGADEAPTISLDDLRKQELDLNKKRSSLADDLNQKEHDIASLEERIESLKEQRPRSGAGPPRPLAAEENLSKLKEAAAGQRRELDEIETKLATTRGDIAQIAPPPPVAPHAPGGPPSSPIGQLDVPPTPGRYAGTRKQSWNPDVYLSPTQSGYRDNIQDLLQVTPDSDLAKALLENRKIVPYVTDPAIIAMRPEIFVAGHARTKLRSQAARDTEVIVLTSAHRNAEFSARLENTGERMSEYAYVIDGIAVEPGTAWDLVKHRGLPREVVEKATRIPLAKL